VSKAIVLNTGGGWQETEIGSFADIQRICGGFVEVLALNESTLLWLDEEGKIKGKSPCPAAIMLTAHIGLQPGDLVVGDCVVTGLEDEAEDSDYRDVPSWVAYRLSGKGSG
jgi:Domain of unknown function (DUF3846)